MRKIISALVIAFIFTTALSVYSKNVNESLSQNIVRLHIIANSDSKEDQELKLLVRDRILRDFSPDFKNKDDALKYLQKYKESAEDELLKNGSSDKVRVEYGNFYFPTKDYDNFSLPAGNYDAVRIVIGEGKGKNWWCVLFPPLCFTDATCENANSEALKELIGEENYKLVSDTGSLPIKVKFKVVEWFEKLREEKRMVSER